MTIVAMMPRGEAATASAPDVSEAPAVQPAPKPSKSDMSTSKPSVTQATCRYGRRRDRARSEMKPIAARDPAPHNCATMTMTPADTSEWPRAMSHTKMNDPIIDCGHDNSAEAT